MRTILAGFVLAWQWQNPSPTGNQLYAVRFLDASTAVAVGEAGAILRSTDAGASWQALASGAEKIDAVMAEGLADHGCLVLSDRRTKHGTIGL